MAEASDFKIGKQVRFAKAHQEIAPRRKIGRGHGLGEFPKILLFLRRLKLATSNLVCSLGLPRAIVKSHAEEKWAWPWAKGAPKIWGFLFNKPAMTEGNDFKIGNLVGFAKAHHKILPRRKKGVAVG